MVMTCARTIYLDHARRSFPVRNLEPATFLIGPCEATFSENYVVQGTLSFFSDASRPERLKVSNQLYKVRERAEYLDKRGSITRYSSKSKVMWTVSKSWLRFQTNRTPISLLEKVNYGYHQTTILHQVALTYSVKDVPGSPLPARRADC